MRTIPPAETFIINKLDETQPNENRPPTPKQVEEWMIEFAKMHVTEALKMANKKAKNSHIDEIIEDVVLTAYDLDDVE
jgi:hypothetical protein